MEKTSDMQVICNNTAISYMMYALGAVIFLFIGVISGISIQAGAWEEAAQYIILCMFLSVIILVSCILIGYGLHAERIYFNDQGLVIGRPFRPAYKMTWFEVGRLEIPDEYHMLIYDREGKIRANVCARMINYSAFYRTAAAQCKPYLQENRTAVGSDRMITFGGESYVAAVMGIVLCLLPFIFSKGDVRIIIDYLMSHDSSMLFPCLFPFAAGILGVWYLIYISSRKVVYNGYQIEFRYLLRKNAVIKWTEVEKINFSVDKLFRRRNVTFICRKGRFTISSAWLTKGFQDFLRELPDIMKKYEITTG